MEKILTFSAEVTCDADKRTISGKIVPIGTGEIGNTSAGRVVFENGSIQIPDDPKKVKLLNQHNIKEPLGRAMYFNEVPNDGIYAAFKVSNSTRGTDALVLASEGLQAGLSVGVEVHKSFNKAGVMHVTIGQARIKQGTRIGQYLSFNAEALHKYDGDYGIGKSHDEKYGVSK